MTLTVKPLQNIGAEVSGFDITRPFSDTLRQELRDPI